MSVKRKAMTTSSYNVQKILDKKIEDGVLYYQLLWAGYDQSNSWQPLENLECPLLVAEYEGKHVLKQTKPLQAESVKILHFCKSESTLVVFWDEKESFSVVVLCDQLSNWFDKINKLFEAATPLMLLKKYMVVPSANHDEAVYNALLLDFEQKLSTGFSDAYTELNISNNMPPSFLVESIKSLQTTYQKTKAENLYPELLLNFSAIISSNQDLSGLRLASSFDIRVKNRHYAEDIVILLADKRPILSIELKFVISSAPERISPNMLCQMLTYALYFLQLFKTKKIVSALTDGIIFHVFDLELLSDAESQGLLSMKNYYYFSSKDSTKLYQILQTIVTHALNWMSS